MKLSVNRAALSALSLALALLSLGGVALALPEHNVPRAVEFAADHGRVSSSKEINLTVVLKLHNEADYDKAVALQPKHSYLLRANAYFHLGKYDLALADCDAGA